MTRSGSDRNPRHLNALSRHFSYLIWFLWNFRTISCSGNFLSLLCGASQVQIVSIIGMRSCKGHWTIPCGYCSWEIGWYFYSLEIIAAYHDPMIWSHHHRTVPGIGQRHLLQSHVNNGTSHGERKWFTNSKKVACILDKNGRNVMVLRLLSFQSQKSQEQLKMLCMKLRFGHRPYLETGMIADLFLWDLSVRYIVREGMEPFLLL